MAIIEAVFGITQSQPKLAVFLANMTDLMPAFNRVANKNLELHGLVNPLIGMVNGLAMGVAYYLLNHDEADFTTFTVGGPVVGIAAGLAAEQLGAKIPLIGMDMDLDATGVGLLGSVALGALASFRPYNINDTSTLRFYLNWGLTAGLIADFAEYYTKNEGIVVSSIMNTWNAIIKAFELTQKFF